jgi:hypothetical protein
MNFYEILPGHRVKLADPENGFQYSVYTYRILNGKPNFIPDDETLDSISRSSLKDILQYYDPLTEEGKLYDNYICDNRCYIYNNVRFQNIELVPYNLVIKGRDDYVNSRIDSIRNAVFLPPIDVKYDGKFFRIVNGNHRFIYSMERGFTHIPVKVQNR